MRVVLDTNVLVSGLLSPGGPPGSIISAVLDGAIIVLVDNRIMFEYEDVLRRSKFGFDSRDVRAFLDFFQHESEFVTAKPFSTTLADPADLPFFEVATTAAADYLITGNTKHFPEEPWILSPRQFLRILFARE